MLFYQHSNAVFVMYGNRFWCHDGEMLMNLLVLAPYRVSVAVNRKHLPAYVRNDISSSLKILTQQYLSSFATIKSNLYV
jgi:hypothetical protein